MKGKMGIFIIKVDLAKTYDWLRWSFVRDNLMALLATVSISVVWNGGRSDFFLPQSDIPQWGPVDSRFLNTEDLAPNIPLESLNWKVIQFLNNEVRNVYGFITGLLTNSRKKRGVLELLSAITLQCKWRNQYIHNEEFIKPSHPWQDIMRYLQIIGAARAERVILPAKQPFTTMVRGTPPLQPWVALIQMELAIQLLMELVAVALLEM
ncbi:hypothetical protein VNO77_10178 [Canavalia gladiata]|uniref:Uncharacterized protein n=1 Tax=Canavalia gladiata TaxID=3824 RepID=A0AAN9MGN0_CANGL